MINKNRCKNYLIVMGKLDNIFGLKYEINIKGLACGLS